MGFISSFSRGGLWGGGECLRKIFRLLAELHVISVPMLELCYLEKTSKPQNLSAKHNFSLM